MTHSSIFGKNRSNVSGAAFYRTYLLSELSARCRRNPRYSMRAFARALEMSDGALSEILSGKRVPARRTAERIVAQLSLNPVDRARFLSSLAERHRSRGLQRLSPFFRNLDLQSIPEELSVELFRAISDWYHVPILELTFIRGFEMTPQSISKTLGISVAEAIGALERLQALGLLEERNGRLEKTKNAVTTGDKHLTTPALKRLQSQFLEKAIHSLENDPIAIRNHSAMTMAIDPSLIPLAKKLIESFTQDVRRLLTSGNQTQIYNLGVTLVPLSAQQEAQPCGPS